MRTGAQIDRYFCKSDYLVFAGAAACARASRHPLACLIRLRSARRIRLGRLSTLVNVVEIGVDLKQNDRLQAGLDTSDLASGALKDAGHTHAVAENQPGVHLSCPVDAARVEMHLTDKAGQALMPERAIGRSAV